MSKCSNCVATPVCSAYNGHYAVSDADCKLVEAKFTSANTGSPKLPTVKEMVSAFVDDKSTCADGRDMRVLSQFCEFVYRQLRAGA